MSRIEMEGALHRLKGRKMDLAVRIGAKLKSARALLATAAIDPIEKIDIEAAASLLCEASAEKAAYLEVLSRIRTAEDELGG